MVEYWWHGHHEGKGFGFARVLDSGHVTFIFEPKYPEKDRREAQEWFFDSRDGLMMTSFFYWEKLEVDAADPDFYEHFREDSGGREFDAFRSYVMGKYEEVAPLPVEKVGLKAVREALQDVRLPESKD